MTITTDATTGDPDAAVVFNKVRPNARDTSWSAAKAQTNGKTGDLQVLIYEYLVALGPMTDDQIRNAFTRAFIKHSRSGVSARRVELERAGWVRDSGLKTNSDAGSPMIIWEAVPAGTEPRPMPRTTSRAARLMRKNRQDAAAAALTRLGDGLADNWFTPADLVDIDAVTAAVVRVIHERAGEYSRGERLA